ncbi:SLAC1 anion channel family protein [Thiohalobacter sp. COW1]|uniref:SLAC1 anion channel family protein n=1 Tax=Thiohalobacter sp. COW1 TaxID=2795687 RepID=UPI001915640E|nr:SLAC1 anion channel family protein [Thiohalobacter sp. COW1]
MTSTRLQNLPVSFFSSVMGLAGLAIALQRAGELWAPLHPFGLLVAVLSALVFIALTGLYAAKLFRYRAEAVAELTHPVKMSFGATFSVSLVLLSVAFLSSQPALSFWLWAVGAGLHLVFTLYVLSAWIHKENFDINHISPAWFIPVVGNILVPVAGVAHASAELSWFFFSIGLLFWIVLFTIIVYRMIFHNPLPDKLLPTLFILIAPPAVGFISYIKLTGDIDSFARVLYYGALFLTLLLFKELPRFVRLPFYLSWWAYSFPLAAMTVATLIMQAHVPSAFFTFLSWIMVVVLDLVIVYLLARTLVAVTRKQICVEGH